MASSSAIRADYPEPLWLQAVNLLMAEIQEGRLTEGSRLPPERELCAQLNISRVTLRKALNHLVEQRVLSPSHGRGWYVALAEPVKEWPHHLESFSETAARMGLQATSVVVRAESDTASIDEAESLVIAPGRPVFRIDRIRMLDGVPIALDRSIVPLSLLSEPAEVDFTEDSLYRQLQLTGHGPERADSIVEAGAADESTAALLGIEAGRPLLVMHQTAYGSDGRPVSMSTIAYVGDRYRLRTAFTRAH
ncbi:MAG: GntR family transcriptional regulator [Actinobacteria bacterium]|nr:GntR family transcriptional regulator [Actinomycetota bacterium]